MRYYADIAYRISIFFIALPPFVLPFLPLNTHSITKLIWIALLGLILVSQILNHPMKKETKATHLEFFFVIYFVTQAVSIFAAQNPGAYVARFEDFFFAGMFFIVSLSFIKTEKQIVSIIRLLVIAASINLFLQLVLFLFPDTFFQIADIFMSRGYVDLMHINAQRQRIYLETYDEIVVPFLFILFRKNQNKVTPTLVAAAIFVASFISNFRTRFVMLMFSLGSSLIFFMKKARTLAFIIIGCITVVGIASTIIFSNINGFTVLDRFFLQDQREDVFSISGRFERWGAASEMGMSSPIIGVGLGNYSEYIPTSKKISFWPVDAWKKEYELAATDPHGIFFRIFAETGFLGLSGFLLLIGFFIKTDLKTFRSNSVYGKAIAISFWTLFLYALFNPTTTTSYQALFWLLRVMKEKTVS